MINWNRYKTEQLKLLIILVIIQIHIDSIETIRKRPIAIDVFNFS